MTAGVSPAGPSTAGGPPAPTPGPHSRPGPGERGQTTFDFAIGMSIFLVAIAFVFVFVPGMLEPFAGNTQTETTAVNRVANDLAQRTLGNASEPYVLGTRCTREFFTAGAPAACHFGAGSTAQRVGVVDRTPVNVTIRGDLDDSGSDSVLCWAGGSLAERSGSCGTVFARGPDPAGSGGKTVSAHRVALLEGHDVTVEVVMW